MKPIVLFLLPLFIFTSFRHSETSEENAYRWVRAIATGDQSWPRWIVPIVGSDNRLRMISNDQTWTSIDGINWLAAKNGAQSAVRAGASQIFFRGRFWLMGGMKDWSEFTNDIWSSPDAIKWTQVSEHAPWAPRRNALVIEFKDKLWLFGGSESSGKRNVLPDRFFTDAWQTMDGMTWVKISDNAPSKGEQVVVFQNRIWIFGDGSAWSSSDGIHWERRANGRPFSDRGGFGAAGFDDKLWVFGGIGATKTMNEVWCSTDGANWQKEPSNAPWFPRGGEYSAVFKDKLWIFGGKTGEGYEHADDVWYMTK